MSEDDGLFREEALQRWRERGQGEVLRLTPRWTRWTFALVASAAAAAAVFAATARVTTYASGPAVLVETRPGRPLGVLGVVAGRHRPRMQVGAPLFLRLEGERSARALHVGEVEPRVLGPDEVRRLSGGALADGAPRGAAVVLRGVLEQADPGAPLHPGMTGRIEVPLGRERLLRLLLPWLGASGER